MVKENIKFKDFIISNISAYVLSVLLAITGVFFGLVPYFVVYRLLLSLSKSGTGKNVVFYVIVIILAFGLQILLHSISTAISHKTAFSILEKIRLAITEKMMKMPLGYTQMKGSGYFHSLLIDSIERLEYPLAHALPETTSNVLIPLGIIGVLFVADWRIALSVLIPAAVTLLFYLPMYVGIMNEFANTYYGALENMNGRVIEYIRGNKEIKIFGQEDSAYSKYEESIDSYKKATLRLYNKMYFTTSPAFVLLSSILVSVLCVGGLLYCKGNLSALLYLFSIVISMGIGNSLLKFTEFMDNFYHIKNGKRLVEEVLSAPELSVINTADKRLKGNEIVLKDVSFAYEKEKVLDGISLVFAENSKTAIVGPSGSGKTTVANLIARFWDVSEGEINIGGVDYKDISLSCLMEHINYVTQDTFLFNMSIKENIRLGKPDASDSEVIEAIRLAQCKEFISKLEHGYDTIAGDEGTKLSGGQRQRIIIARAILRNAPVLILDEATAYADMENQHKIQKALQELCKDKTLILIAHRLSTIMDCDQIIVMEDGKVEATGTHEDLLRNSMLYQRMWNIYDASRKWKVGKNEEVSTC